MADKRETAGNGAAQSQGTVDEAIGRPGPWGENRYEKKDQRLEQSVLTPPGAAPSVDKPASTPVTRRDYIGGSGDEETPGGDAG
jgi:hypothetical protein